MTIENKIGVWLIGARGSISATLIAGSLALAKKLIPPVGMVTETEAFDDLDLTAVENIHISGCDVRQDALWPNVWQELKRVDAIDFDTMAEFEAEVKEIERRVQRGTLLNCGSEIESLPGIDAQQLRTLEEEVDAVRQQFTEFRKSASLDRLIVVNLASTEPPLEIQDGHQTITKFVEMVKSDDRTQIQASTIYAYAAILEECPYLNFTPSNGALIPALVQLAKEKGVPVMGCDGKTGETLVKSALAPMFQARNLEVLSWQGYNMLGNMDGKVLSNSENREAKLRSKNGVLEKILGYTVHSQTHIDYVPSLGDQKTAMDFVHFQGFLGAKMSLQFTWQGYDSLLAAPLVLDLVRLIDLAARRGESGLLPHLAVFFKDPHGVAEHGLSAQFDLLLDYAKSI